MALKPPSSFNTAASQTNTEAILNNLLSENQISTFLRVVQGIYMSVKTQSKVKFECWAFISWACQNKAALSFSLRLRFVKIFRCR